MGNIAQKLEYLKDTKEAIKTAIVGKGGSIADDANFRSYAETITNLPSGGGEDIEPIVLTGNCQYACGGDVATWTIENYGHIITTKDITNMTYMFYKYKGKSIPFEINTMKDANMEVADIFYQCTNLETLPKFGTYTRLIGSGAYMFAYCERLRDIPDSFFDNTNIGVEGVMTQTGNMGGVFSDCHSLRKLPMKMLRAINGNNMNYSSSIYSNMAFNCHSMDEIVELPILYTREWKHNGLANIIQGCYRLKRFTFALNEGIPYIEPWKNQIIEMRYFIGYGTIVGVTGYNSGITADKEVYDDATYQALKNDPDWFSIKPEYSRYNRISAVETINSLPDTSAYLLENGGTNYINFKGIAGSKTDGGAINTMTAEEIAVATAKGWTVSLD